MQTAIRIVMYGIHFRSLLSTYLDVQRSVGEIRGDRNDGVNDVMVGHSNNTIIDELPSEPTSSANQAENQSPQPEPH